MFIFCGDATRAVCFLLLTGVGGAVTALRFLGVVTGVGADTQMAGAGLLWPINLNWPLLKLFLFSPST